MGPLSKRRHGRRNPKWVRFQSGDMVAAIQIGVTAYHLVIASRPERSEPFGCGDSVAFAQGERSQRAAKQSPYDASEIASGTARPRKDRQK
jgi:hypothetical protein